VNVETYVPSHNPYHFGSKTCTMDDEELRQAFANATDIEIGPVGDHHTGSTFSAFNHGATSKFLAATPDAFPEFISTTGGFWTLKMVKVGILKRKDDMLEGVKKAFHRKWHAWGIVLTASHLLLFRDSSCATNLLLRRESCDRQGIFLPLSEFKPDELWPIKDSIAVVDDTYSKVCKFFACYLASVDTACSMKIPFGSSCQMVDNRFCKPPIELNSFCGYHG
jgi:hypothetical protein